MATNVTSNSISPWARAYAEIRNNKLAMFCVGILALLGLAAILAPWIAPHDPDAINFDHKLLAPAILGGQDHSYWLGTDNSGRDVLSRLLYGARISLSLGIVPVVIASVIGVPLGLVSGYLGKRFDEVVMRVIDVLLAFPSILLALIVVAFLGQGIFNLMIAVGVSYAPTFARIVRSAVVGERNKEYVAGAVSLGAGHDRVIFKHLFPNITSSLIVVFTLTFASALVEAAGLSFLGLGVRPPSAEWGSMLSDVKNYFYDGVWMILMPGALIFITVISFNVLGDCLRDAFDPRFKGRS